MGMSSSAYARVLKQLLPGGSLWSLEPANWLSKLMLAISDELARVDSRADALLEEGDPRTATETLTEWERFLGLPDACVTAIPATTAARRVAVTQKLVKRGGQAPAFYIALAAACGYTVTIADSYGLTVCRAGRARSGDRCFDQDWAHVWKMNVQPPAGTALSHAELECIISRSAPAHTVVLFNYL